MSKEKTINERTASQLAEDTIEVIQLEGRLEMVQADSLLALAS